MKMTNYLTVVEVSEPKLDKNQEKQYKKISVISNPFVLTIDPITGEEFAVPLPSKQSAFIAYENNYLGKQDFGWNLIKGQRIAGSIVSRKVEPYTIEKADGTLTEPLNVASVIVLGDTASEEFEIEVEKAFKARDFQLLGSSSKVNTNPTVVTKEAIRQEVVA